MTRFPEYDSVDNPYFTTFAERGSNWVNNLDNTLDPVHVPFVHPAHNPDVATRYGSWDVARKMMVEVEESDWGITMRTYFGDGTCRLSQQGMPNMQRYNAGPTKANIPDIPGPRRVCIWKVPIDDGRHVRFMMTSVECAPEDRTRWEERMAEMYYSKWTADIPALLDEVLTGKRGLKELVDPGSKDPISFQNDVAHMDTTSFQDDVAQSGQGVIWDRKNETLGRSDNGLILQRKIWARELQALAEGRPIKQWTYNPQTIQIERRVEA